MEQQSICLPLGLSKAKEWSEVRLFWKPMTYVSCQIALHSWHPSLLPVFIHLRIES